MKISEVSERYDISPDTLRYYERVGLIPTVIRNQSGMRDYNQTDIDRVDFIKCMKSAGLPTVQAPAEWFAGAGRIDPLFEAKDPCCPGRAYVTFEVGTLTGWHTHPLGKTLIITASCILVQRWVALLQWLFSAGLLKLCGNKGAAWY